MTAQSKKSPTWVEIFRKQVDPEQTAKEVAFLLNYFPTQTANILDVGCGSGRFSRAFANLGFRVTGIDQTADIIEMAGLAENVDFRVWDQRELDQLDGVYEVVLCMWQNFGLFDRVSNREVLRKMSELMPVGGRIFLDIYHRPFFALNQGVRKTAYQGGILRELKTLKQDTLSVKLEYPNQIVDVFEWQLYTSREICEMGEMMGLECILVCADFDELQAPTNDHPRIQIVLERYI